MLAAEVSSKSEAYSVVLAPTFPSLEQLLSHRPHLGAVTSISQTWPVLTCPQTIALYVAGVVGVAGKVVFGGFRGVAYKHACMRVCMFGYSYVRVCVCMYVQMHIQVQSHTVMCLRTHVAPCLGLKSLA